MKKIILCITVLASMYVLHSCTKQDELKVAEFPSNMGINDDVEFPMYAGRAETCDACCEEYWECDDDCVDHAPSEEGMVGCLQLCRGAYKTCKDGGVRRVYPVIGWELVPEFVTLPEVVNFKNEKIIISVGRYNVIDEKFESGKGTVTSVIIKAT